MTSCGSLEQPSEETKKETTKTITLIEKDTVFTTKKDSSFYKAYIKCVNNKPVLTKPKKESIDTNELTPKKTPGKYLKPPNVSLKDSVLNVNCQAEAQQLFFKWKEQFIQEQTTTVKTITLPAKLIEKKLSWWQKLWLALGKILTLVVTIWLLTKISWKNLFGLLVRLVTRV